ncbi:S8 family serine peptidase [Nocardioides hankookensis]|uniref:S8 family serine peptidase n=1 Tax=Nocardioides hankookensis TaxID=443157 RepID=A0ABW1LQP6_9ACTN
MLGTASLAVPTGAASAADHQGLPAPTRAALGKAAPGAHVGDRPAGIPATGRYSFLLQLDTRSTGRAFAANRSAGRSAASTAARQQLSKVTAAQNAVIGDLPARTPVLYRMHAALAGVAVTTNVANYDELTDIAGVAHVYPIAPKSPSNSYAVPLQGAPAAWEGSADLGENTVVGIIDTGIDYTHANFGGAGTSAAYDAEHAHADDATLWGSSVFPTSKVIGGYDLVGDTYQADPNTAGYQPVPVPDPNPLDCEGHGSHVAGSAAGLGVTDTGDTYTGDYDTSTDFGALRIGPGMAPAAKLMAFRVFGCEGSTDVTAAAIDRALDPNDDGSMADAVDVINMSLGSDFGSPEDGDAIASDAAAALGVTMAISAGNSDDLYDVSGSPGSSTRAITVAASVDAQSIVDGLDVTYSVDGDEQYASERSIAYDWDTKPDLAGQIVDLGPNVTGCTAFTDPQKALIAGKIPILKWTDDNLECGSVARSGNVAAAGGVGFVFHSNLEAFSAGITGSAVIPGVLVNNAGGAAIRAAIAGGQTVTVTGTERNGVTQTFPDDDDTMAGFSSRGSRGAGHLKPDVTAVGGTVFSTSVGTGNEGETESGTSMAAPMVAGLSALVISAHPGWTPEQVKADIMNTAGQDLDTNGSDTAGGDRYAPNRVGSGRIKADDAVRNEVLAYAAGGTGAVSVSFGPVEVTDPVTVSKTVTVENTGATSRTYDTSYDAITSVPGVDYEISPASVTVAPGATQTVTVTLSVDDPSALTKTVDPTHGRGDDDQPLESLADASGNLLLTPTSGSLPELRVPVYSAPRPASSMTQPGSVTLTDGEGTLALSGDDVDQGADEENVTSLVTGLELQGTSPALPACAGAVTTGCVHGPTDSGADLQYVGVTSDAPFYGTPSNGQAYFGISTHGAHSTAASKVEFDIYLDVDEDGTPDLVAYNTRLTDSDVFVTSLVDLGSGDTIDTEVTNNRFGDVDTAIFDSDVLLMPVWLKPLLDYGVNAASPRVNYAIASYTTSSTGEVDEIGWDGNDVDGSLSADLYNPGVLVTGDGVTGDVWGANSPFGPLIVDSDGATLDVTSDTSSYADDNGQGVLMLHFHNEVGNKAQVVALKSATTVTLGAVPASVPRGTATQLTVTVANSDAEGAVPTGSVTVTDTDTSTVVASGPLGAGGTVTLPYTPTSVGTQHLVATYAGTDALAGSSSTPTTLTVTAAGRDVTLGAAPTSVVRGDDVALTVGVAHGAGDPVPTGSVSVVDGAGATVASGTLGADGTASLSFTPTKPGTLSLHATYAGDANTAAGQSSAVTVTVKKATARVTLGLPRSAKPGARVRANVAIATVNGIPATGKVVLKGGGKTLGSAKLVKGRATVVFKAPKKGGKLKVQAVYAGDSTYSSGKSSVKVLTVTKPRKKHR